VIGTAADRLAGARVHPRVSALPSSGSVTAPLDPVPHTIQAVEVWRTHGSSCLSPAHAKGIASGGGGDGEMGPAVGPPSIRPVPL
jgi:hypothetical protein